MLGRRTVSGIMFALLLIGMFSFAAKIEPVKSGESEYVTGRIENPVDQSNIFKFDADEYPVGSVFTVDFYIINVTNMIGWQIYISWNISIINYTAWWFPENHVFKEAEEKGATLISPIVFYEWEGMGYVQAGMTTLPLYPVNVTGKGLLCKMNFTIVATPPIGEYFQTNMVMIKEAPGSQPGSFDSFVIIYPFYYWKIPIMAEPAQIYIVNPEYDIGITEIVPQKTVIGEDYNLTIYITVKNYGAYTETFNVTLYANATSIEYKTITLTNETSTTIIFTWNTSGFAKGKYTIWAYAEPVPGETYTADNTFTYGIITITIPGDVDGDFKVKMDDIIALCTAFGSKTGQPKYAPNCDIDGNGKIDMGDIVTACGNFGKHFP